MLISACWLWVADFWLLISSCWFLVADFSCWSLVADVQSLIFSCCFVIILWTWQFGGHGLNLNAPGEGPGGSQPGMTASRALRPKVRTTAYLVQRLRLWRIVNVAAFWSRRGPPPPPRPPPIRNYKAATKNQQPKISNWKSTTQNQQLKLSN